MDSRLATQGIDFQSRVVGKAVVAIVVEDILCLGEAIFLQRSPVFGNILVATDVGQGEELVALSQNLAQFAQLVRVVGCKNQFYLVVVHVLFVVYFLLVYHLLVDHTFSSAAGISPFIVGFCSFASRASV